MIQQYLFTRGRKWDYCYINASPEKRPWEHWAQELDFEQGTIFVFLEDNYLSAFLTGIPSQRRDEKGTPIRYSLAFEGEIENQQLMFAFLEIVRQWFEIKYPTSHITKPLKETLDTLFSEEMIEQYKRGNAQQEIENKLSQWFDSFIPDVYIPEYEQWIGGIHSASCRAIFQEHINQAFISEQSMYAIYINGLETQDDVKEILLNNHKGIFDPESSNNPFLAILINDPKLKEPKDLSYLMEI